MNRSHQISRGFSKLAIAAAMTVLAATVAVAKTAEQCQADYDTSTRICYANPDTSQMDTPTDVRYCLQRAKNKFTNCMSNATMSVPGSLQLGPVSKGPKAGLSTKNILDSGILDAGRPTPTGTPIAPAAPAGRIL